MNVVLLRVGVDSGSGGIQGPLYSTTAPSNSSPSLMAPALGCEPTETHWERRGCPYSAYFPGEPVEYGRGPGYAC